MKNFFKIYLANHNRDTSDKLALFATFASIFSKGIVFIYLILSIRFTFPYLEVDRFSMWMTISSFIGLLAFADLGLGNATINEVARVKNKNIKNISKPISTSLVLSFFLTLTLIVAYLSIEKVIPVNILFRNFDQSILPEARLSLKIFIISFSINIFFSSVHKIFHALQIAYKSHLLMGICNLFVLGILYFFTKNQLGVPYLVPLAFLGNIISGFLLLIVILLSKFDIFCSLKKINKKYFSEFFKTAGMYLLLQLGVISMTGADITIVTLFGSPEQVALFAILIRLFQLILEPVNLFNYPIWATIANAESKNDYSHIKSILIRYTAITIIFALIGCLLIFVMSDLIFKYIFSIEIFPESSLIAVYAIQVLIFSSVIPFSMYLNGLKIIKIQIYSLTTLISISIPLKVFLLAYFNLESMILGFFLFYILNFTFWTTLYRDKIFNRLNV